MSDRTRCWFGAVTGHTVPMARMAIALRDLLNSSKPAVDEDGYLMWNRCYGMCNTQCWQWELACAHSTCINQIMRRADVDWADAGVPDIDMPTITINLSIN